MYVYVRMYICILIYIPKYNLFSLHNVACMYVFRPDHLAMDKQLVCSSLEKTSLVVCSSLGGEGPHSFPFGTSVVLVKILFR